MTNNEAIDYAGAAAADHGLEWNEVANVRRFRLWPWQPLWLISSPVGEDASGFTVVFLQEETARTRVYRVRPWTDYSMVRIVLFPLLLLAGLGFLTTIGMRVLGLFSAQLGSSGPNGILFGLLGGLTLFSMPALRLLGKDAWFLRREIRAGLRREKSGAENQPVEAEVTEDEVDEQDDWHMSNSSLRNEDGWHPRFTRSSLSAFTNTPEPKGRTTSPYPFT